MDILNEALEFVNKQIAFHKTKAEEFAPSNSRRAQHHAKTADGMTEVANLLTKQSVMPALRHACGRRAGGRRLSCRQGP